MHIKRIKSFLVFFYIFLCYNCKHSRNTDIIITNKTLDTDSISLTLPKTFSQLSLFLENHTDTPILGVWSNYGNNYTFKPIIPFTIGETYEIRTDNNVIYTFKVKNTSSNNLTELLNIYPTTDTVPENLLKMYFKFSNPMQEVVNAIDYISIVDTETNQNVSLFLELQSELWNKEHTILTLWIDPGRVKTDLIPNKKLGLPLLNNHQYIISISQNWKDANGFAISKNYTKKLYVTHRDSIKPKPSMWFIGSVKANTKAPLIIDFKEPMDFLLINECFSIYDSSNRVVAGKFTVSNEEKGVQFYPDFEWQQGEYTLVVQSLLEDLAGNNLNHLFDTDLKKNTNTEASIYKSITFKTN